MDRAVTDIIDLIDQVTAPTCGSCAKPLRADGPSLDFCGEVCAEAWNAGRTPSLMDRLTPAGRPAEFLPTTPLPGFRMELTDGRTWPAWTPTPNTVAVTPLDPGAPWLRSPITPPSPPVRRPDDLATGYRLPCGRRLAVQHDTAGFAATPMCRVIERFPTGDKFQWVMPLSQLTELAADLVALETIWDLAIKSELGRVQRRTFPDGSWDVTDQRPPWRSDPLARVVGGSLNGQVIGVPPRPRPVLEMATAGGMEQYELLVSTSDGENYLYRYVHMPTGHVTYIEEQPG